MWETISFQRFHLRRDPNPYLGGNHFMLFRETPNDREKIV